MGKLPGLIAAALLTFGMGAANAGETPQILGAVDYQAMSQSQMANITGEHHTITNTNSNVNNNNRNQSTQVAFVAAPPNDNLEFFL